MEAPEEHIKALDANDLQRLKELTGSLDLTKPHHQCEFLARIEEENFRPIRIEVSSTDVAIEYLFVAEGLLVGDICSELRLDGLTCRKRLMHLAKEAHDRTKRANCEVAA